MTFVTSALRAYACDAAELVLRAIFFYLDARLCRRGPGPAPNSGSRHPQHLSDDPTLIEKHTPTTMKQEGLEMHKHLVRGILASLLLATPAFAEDQIKVACGDIGPLQDMVPEIGNRLGIFKKYNLAVEPLYTQGSAESLQAVLSGSVQVAIAAGTFGVFSAYAKGRPGPGDRRDHDGRHRSILGTCARICRSTRSRRPKARPSRSRRRAPRPRSPCSPS